jgi:hypothetical protein
MSDEFKYMLGKKFDVILLILSIMILDIPTAPNEFGFFGIGMVYSTFSIRLGKYIDENHPKIWKIYSLGLGKNDG